jgi:hypothetical protein
VDDKEGKRLEISPTKVFKGSIGNNDNKTAMVSFMDTIYKEGG